SEIAIQFSGVPHRLFADTATDPQPNLLAIRIQPDEGILLRFGSKVPGLGLDIRPVNMDFTYGSAFNVDPPDAYETLIPDSKPGEAVLRWNARARSIAGIERELARIWSSVSLATPVDGGEPERRVAPRSSVMNLVVIAGRSEVGERIASIVDGLTGRHPSRT